VQGRVALPSATVASPGEGKGETDSARLRLGLGLNNALQRRRAHSAVVLAVLAVVLAVGRVALRCTARAFSRPFAPTLALAVGSAAQEQQDTFRDRLPLLVRPFDEVPLVVSPPSLFPSSFLRSGRRAHLVCCLECSLVFLLFFLFFSSYSRSFGPLNDSLGPPDGRHTLFRRGCCLQRIVVPRLDQVPSIARINERRLGSSAMPVPGHLLTAASS
jgi:hypothetical protein